MTVAAANLEIRFGALIGNFLTGLSEYLSSRYLSPHNFMLNIGSECISV
jgi:hypothetical protein